MNKKLLKLATLAVLDRLGVVASDKAVREVVEAEIEALEPYEEQLLKLETKGN